MVKVGFGVDFVDVFDYVDLNVMGMVVFFVVMIDVGLW